MYRIYERDISETREFLESDLWINQMEEDRIQRGQFD